MTSTTPPQPGWYRTADRAFERYWDGYKWSEARPASGPVFTHPTPEPRRAQSHRPAYADLPSYAVVPPMDMPGEPRMTESAPGAPSAPSGFAWTAALWPFLTILALVYTDTPDLVAVPVTVAGWWLLASADVAIVGSYTRRNYTLLALVPPVWLALIRPKLTHTGIGVRVLAVVGTVYQVLWTLPHGLPI